MAEPTRYNTAGTVGLLTPQANPVAEIETSILLEPDVTMLVSRMTDDAPSMLDRLKGYTRGLEATLGAFGGAPLDAIGFACTGSSYFDEDVAKSTVAQAGASLTASPFVAAADAVNDALQELGAQTIALVSPYPDDLTPLAAAYWTRRGYEVAQVVSVPPALGSHPIYGLTAGAIHAPMSTLSSEHDAVLLMGTGAPTLPVIAAATGRPVLSSNLCVGWRFAQLLNPSAAPTFTAFAEGDWRARLRQRFPAAVLR